MRQLGTQINTGLGDITPNVPMPNNTYIYWPQNQSSPYSFVIQGSGGGAGWLVTPVPAAQGVAPLNVDLEVVSAGTVSGSGTMTITFDTPAWSAVHLDAVFYPPAPPPPIPPAPKVASTAAPPQLLSVGGGTCSYLQVPNHPDLTYRFDRRMCVLLRGGGYLWHAEAVNTVPDTPLYLQVRCLGLLPLARGGRTGAGQVVVRFTPPGPMPAKQPPPIPVVFQPDGCRPPARCRVVRCPR